MTKEIYNFIKKKLKGMMAEKQAIVIDSIRLNKPFEYLFGKDIKRNASFIPFSS